MIDPPRVLDKRKSQLTTEGQCSTPLLRNESAQPSLPQPAPNVLKQRLGMPKAPQRDAEGYAGLRAVLGDHQQSPNF